MPEAGPEGAHRGLPPGRVRPILLHPDPVLQQDCAPAGYLPGPALLQLAADLLATMYHAQGRGLAAPQIGVTRRIFVMDASWKAGEPAPQVLVDPEIIARPGAVETAEERCLSIPDYPVQVARSTLITLRWFDLLGRRHDTQMAGVDARIAQHEADHLDGRLIIDIPGAL